MLVRILHGDCHWRQSVLKRPPWLHINVEGFNLFSVPPAALAWLCLRGAQICQTVWGSIGSVSVFAFPFPFSLVIHPSSHHDVCNQFLPESKEGAKAGLYQPTLPIAFCYIVDLLSARLLFHAWCHLWLCCAVSMQEAALASREAHITQIKAQLESLMQQQAAAVPSQVSWFLASFCLLSIRQLLRHHQS